MRPIPQDPGARRISSNPHSRLALAALASLCLLPAVGPLAAPPGPAPQIPEGGSAPGPFPNSSVTGVNVLIRGGTEFNSNAEVPGFDGQGPIPWSLNRYNRGDFAMRLSPADPTAATASSLNKGFIEFADTDAALAAHHAWRPSPQYGVSIPVARQNGPVDWNDGEGPFFPTVAISESSSGPGFDMSTGGYGNGNLDINTGRAGTHASSPEANFSYSLAWFPFDQGWLGGEVGSPIVGDPLLPDGSARWTQAGAHAAGLVPGMVGWLQYPADSGAYAGLANLRLPGVNSLEDGMLFTTSADGGSDVNIVGVSPNDSGVGWLVTIREDSATDSETLAESGQSEFQFVYVPFDAARLVGGHILGSNGSKRKAAGDFTVTRSAAGTYEITIPGKTGSSGMLLLQATGLEPGTSTPLATRAFLSYEFRDGRFIVQSRVTSSDSTADLRDSDFYVAWIDFTEPLAPPAGPRLRGLDPVVVSGTDVRVSEAGVAAHTTESEVLVTTLDLDNIGGYLDPITGQPALSAVVGRYFDPRTLQPLSDPFVVLGNPSGIFGRHDVKFNPVSKQYVVIATTRSYGPNAKSVPLIALVKPFADGAGASPVAKAFAYQENTEIDFEDIAVAVSSKSGHFAISGEYKVPDEGEATIAALFDSAGNLLTQDVTRVDLLQSIGDEDDPDITYLPGKDAFLYLSNTDNSNGSTGPYSNRVVGSLIDPVPDAQGKLVVRPEQALGDGEPAGTAEGHPAALENPFNGELIVAYDAGNNTSRGDLAFVNIGAAPTYTFSPARPEVPYFNGVAGSTFRHQHPQLAADPQRGVIAVGFNATGNDLGIPDAYAVTLLGPDGLPLPSQLDAPYLVAPAPGGLGNSANFHVIKYSPPAASFVIAYTTSTPTATYLATLQVTSDHLPSGEAPTLTLTRNGASLVLSWPAATTGFTLQSSSALGAAANWSTVSTTPVSADGVLSVTVSPTDAARFYRLAQP